MNSYPPELLAQLAPVMFVAGLDTSSTTPQMPSNQTSIPPSPKAQDFSLLAQRLREALQAQRKVAIWQPEKSKSFQVILVDKDVPFPPRKLVPSDDPQHSSAHSPLSPMTPSSPLHPDGLIAPIWIRKHTTLVPSVFVLFLRIYESTTHTPRSPLDAPDVDRDRDREQEERRRDTELAAEVALRKKSTNERGIKLTVVLMASRKMLDEPTLDSRLTYIRRQSGLDSRAALFVLSPVSPAELVEFVKSLQQALYDSALEYYTAHSKRVRRKRNRHSQAVSFPTSLVGSPNIARPLRPEGWTVRYEYKMACFAEFRGEDEVALKHYQDAHAMLVVMFGSTAILPPRTKRWAEAKVLADCINVKITKLYLYNNEHALALSHHNAHVRMFGDFSRGWGIGDETFEYWSWMARQHRVLAELLEQGTRSTLKIPIHKYIPPTASNPAMAASQVLNPNSTRGAPITGTSEMDYARSLGINPSHALQHPGFYYYMAARCTEMRRGRFLFVLDAESSQHHPQQSVALSPGFANEKKVDHLTIILELYTKAYELFKKHTAIDPQNSTQGRLTLWIAYRIAQTYYESGKFDMAIRFFERIAKTYRREKWGVLLRPLLSTWYSCAQQLGDVELSVRLLVEMFGHGAAEGDDPTSTEEDLLAVLKSTVPSSEDTLVVDLSESKPMFDSNVVFWAQEVKVDEIAPFQISLTAPLGISIASLPFSTLAVYCSHTENPIIIRHTDVDSSENSKLVQRVDLGHITVKDTSREVVANLRWQQGACIVFSGVMSSSLPTSLKVSKLVLTIKESKWMIDIPFDPCASHDVSLPMAKWLSSMDPPRHIPIKRDNSSHAIVRHRPHDLVVSLGHQSPAYLDENYPITIDITNNDDRALDVVIDILLQPIEIDDALNTIILDEDSSSGFIKGVRFGILAPGVSVIKTLYLLSTGAGGDRMIDISIQSKSTDTAEIPPDNPEVQDITEILKTLVVPTVDPIKVTQSVAYMRSLTDWHGLADLRSYNPEFWDDGECGEALINTVIECAGPSAILVESLILERQDHEKAKVIDCSIDDSDISSCEYLPGDEWGQICRVSVVSADHSDLAGSIIPGPGKYRLDWRRIRKDGKLGSISSTFFPLPSLKPPVDGLVALLNAPSVATLHNPISLTLTVRNHHPSRSANITVQLEPDVSDSFVVAGLRSGRVPILMPRAEEKVTWRLVPTECGHVKIPRIKVMNRRKGTTTNESDQVAEPEPKGELVTIIDVRVERRTSEIIDVSQDTSADGTGNNPWGTILVLPQG